MKAWPKDWPLCVHAEQQNVAAVILLAELHDRPVHICHVARRAEIEIIKAAKNRGIQVTCEVCPHHLFLTRDDASRRMGGNSSRSRVCPTLGSQDDQDALWENMEFIDTVVTDHAPHTLDEKSGENAPPGFPGLETSLALMLTAVNQQRISLEDLVEKMCHNPRRIFRLPEQVDTYIEVNLDEKWTIPDVPKFSKAGWTPFSGFQVVGKVKRVVLRGSNAFLDGEILVPEGFGQDVRSWKLKEGLESLQIPPQVRVRHASNASSLCLASPVPGPAGTLLAPVPKHFPSLLAADPPHHLPDDPRSRASMPYGGGGGGGGGKIPAEELMLLSSIGIPEVAPACSRHNLRFKHVLEVSAFSKEQLHALFQWADVFRSCLSRNIPVDHVLKGKVLANVFYESSTRTSLSFAAAMQRLGGQVISMDPVNSSVQKGESLTDTVRVIGSYADVMVLRHPSPGAATQAAGVSKVPLINAGDGVGEHPTQAFLDIFTIRCEIGTVNGIVVVMVGDLKHGRTVHSLARVLALYEGVQIRYVSPEGLAMPEDVCAFLASRGVPQSYYSSVEEAVVDADVLYVTRVQKERFSSPEEYLAACKDYVINVKTMHRAKKGMAVMHPMPRVFEISEDFDTDPRAAYFRQAEYGLYVRMALLAMVLGKC